MLSTEDADTAKPEGPQRMDAVRVLFPVLRTICRYLCRRDLSNLAEVCVTWQEVVLPVCNRRESIERIRLCYKLRNLDSTLNVEPYVSILIFDMKLEKTLPNEKLDRYFRPHKLASRLGRRECHKTVVIWVNEYITTEDPELEIPADQRDEANVKLNVHRGILGLFFPNVEGRLLINVAWQTVVQISEVAEIASNRFAKKLRLGHTGDFNKSAVLVFILANEPGAALVARELQDKIRSDKDSLWVSEVGDSVGAVNYHCSKRKKRAHKQCVLAMRISGPTFESWSEIIDLRLPRIEVDLMLYQLRERVILKKYSMALISGPKNSKYGKNDDIMRSVKSIFPDIPFVGLFNHHSKSIRAPEEWKEERMFVIDDYQKMSLLIITY